MLIAYCYGKPFGEFADLDAAKAAVEQHVLSCPEGAMPWANAVEWHPVDGEMWCSVANDEWLSHDIRPTAQLAVSLLP